MVVGVVIGVCALLVLLAFLVPRLSRHPERGAKKTAGAGGRVAGMAPGKLGHWLRKPFAKSQRAMGNSASAGRRGRSKLRF